MKDTAVKALRYAFPKTIPVMTGYIFLGMAYGILMKVNGYGVLWAALMSVFVYAGSMQYVGITLFVGAVSPLYAFMMALMVNARHLFYGISMLERYRKAGKFEPYLVFALTDETFSVVCNEEVPKDIHPYWTYFWVSLLDQSYWVAGSVLGALAGNLIPFNTAGLDFALTALFVVIFTDQWKGQKDHKPAIIGVVSTAVCLLVFGESMFILPSMALILILISFGNKKEERMEKLA